jgi:putative sterol carrier protein
VHALFTDYLRLSSGELHAAQALIEGRIRIDGDVMLAARLPDLFGAVPPIEIDGQGVRQ